MKQSELQFFRYVLIFEGLKYLIHRGMLSRLCASRKLRLLISGAFPSFSLLSSRIAKISWNEKNRILKTETCMDGDIVSSFYIAIEAKPEDGSSTKNHHKKKLTSGLTKTRKKKDKSATIDDPKKFHDETKKETKAKKKKKHKSSEHKEHNHNSKDAKKECDHTDLAKLIEAADPDVIKKILLAHTQDHRVHMLSYVQGTQQNYHSLKS